MAEEQRCQATKLCANDCGLLGSPATQDLCSKCHRDLQLKRHQSSSAKHAVVQTATKVSSPATSSSPSEEETAETKKVDKKAAAEEQRWQAPKLRANDCGLLVSPATQDLCSKCPRDLQLKRHQSSSAKHAVVKTATASSSPATSSSPSEEQTVETKAATEEVRRPNRCLSCKKRVGLTGFKCRCGMVFCGIHRYPEEHGCGFDFKAMGKQQIAEANPVVKAGKLHKI